MQKLTRGLLIVSVMVVTAHRSATAAPNACVMAARQTFQACQSQCRDDFVSASLVCRNIDPACGTACLAGRQACFDSADQILSSGKLPDGSDLATNCIGGTDACKAVFVQAKQTCGAPCQPTDQTCTNCVDQAQVANFTCRDTCSNDWRTNATVVTLLQACRHGFKQCVKQCPPAAPSQ
ncbi:MAG: hypothetical protein ABSA52_06110 [Candidatus Binatia bacterium]